MRSMSIAALTAGTLLLAGCGSTSLTPAEMQFLQAQAEQPAPVIVGGGL